MALTSATEAVRAAVQRLVLRPPQELAVEQRTEVSSMGADLLRAVLQQGTRERGDSRRLEDHDEALRLVGRLREALDEAPAWQNAVVEAEQLLQDARPSVADDVASVPEAAPGTDQGGFWASRGVPELRRLDRSVIALRPRGSSRPSRTARDTSVLDELVRTIGVLGRRRRLDDGDVWTAQQVAVEQRLLDNLDALMAFGVRRPQVLVERLTRPPSLPADSYAQALALGCLEGEDAAHAAVVPLFEDSAHARSVRAEALALAPNTAIGHALEALVAERKELVALGIDTLARRHEARLASVALLLAHPVPSVRVAAAHASATAGAPEPARALIEMVLQHEDRAPVSLSLAEAALARGSPQGLQTIRELATAGGAVAGRALVRLAQLGTARDAKLAAQQPMDTPEQIEAAGFSGALSAVEPLIAVLDTRDGGMRSAVARALRRIAGPQDDDTERAATWKRWWADIGRGLDPSRKYRAGEPLSSRTLLRALVEEGHTMGDRAAYALELAVRTGEPALPVRGFHRRLEWEVDAMSDRLAAGGLSDHPGRWTGELLAAARST